MQTRSFIGLDVHKDTISVRIAEDGRDGAVRFIGVIANTPDEVAKMAKRLSRHGELDFCYEAGGCGYGIYRQLTALGHKCTVAATSMIPRKPGERIKTDRRDSQKLAILHRSGDLTAVWVPDPTHEALRDLVRARVDASMHLMRARQQLLAFLFRHGRIYAMRRSDQPNWPNAMTCFFFSSLKTLLTLTEGIPPPESTSRVFFYWPVFR
jgi:transposase